MNVNQSKKNNNKSSEANKSSRKRKRCVGEEAGEEVRGEV